MFFPGWFLLAVLVSATGKILDQDALPGSGRRALPWFCLAVAVFLGLYAFAAALEAWSRRRHGRGSAAVLLFLRLRGALPIAFYALLIGLAHWGVVADELAAGHGLVVREVVALAPFLWLEVMAILGETLLLQSSAAAVDRMRSTWLGAPLLFLVLGSLDLGGLHPLTRAGLQELPLASGLLAAAGLGLAMLLFPVWMSIVLPTRKLSPPELLAACRGIAARARVGVRGIRRLLTRGRMLNAAVVGPFAVTRRILFTDLMLELFTFRQVLAVCSHEIAHVARWHVARQIAFFALLPLLFAGPLGDLLPVPQEVAWSAGMLASIGLLLPLFRWVSHRFEHEADLHGMSLLEEPDAMLEALSEADRLSPSRSGRASFRHPSLDSRLRFLSQTAPDAAALRAWARRTHRVQAALFLLLGVGLALAVPRLVEETRRHWPGFLLASGWPSQARQAWGVQPPPAAKDELHARTRDLDQATRATLLLGEAPPGPAAVGELRRQALRRGERALEREDWDAVWGWYGLAVRWGDESPLVGTVHAYLDAMKSGDDGERARARRRLRALPLTEEIRKVVALLPG